MDTGACLDGIRTQYLHSVTKSLHGHADPAPAESEIEAQSLDGPVLSLHSYTDSWWIGELICLAGEGTVSYSSTVKEDELLPAMQTALPGNVSIVHEWFTVMLAN